MKKSAAAKFEVADVEFVPSQLIPIECITESPLNPRKHMRPLDDDFLQSIATKGVDFPILVRPTDQFSKGIKYEIVAGARRFRACQQLGRKEIPATVKTFNDVEVLEHALDENIRRLDMHPIDEARAYADLLKSDGVYNDLKAIGKRFGGKSATYVRDKMKWLKLHPLVVEAFDAEAITAKHAERIALTAPDQHVRALEECFPPMLVDGGYMNRSEAIEKKKWEKLRPALVGYRDLEKWIRKWSKQDVTSGPVQALIQEAIDAGEGEDTLSESEVEAATAKVLHLSNKGGYEFGKTKAREAGVISKNDWKLISSEKAKCKYAKRGVIVHPAEDKPRVVDCCVSKSCSKHWPKPKYSSASSGETPAQKATRERHERERVAYEAAWKDLQPHALAAFAQHVLTMKVDAATFRAVVWPAGFCEAGDIRGAEKTYGVKLTDKNIVAFLLLSCVHGHHRQTFEGSAKRLGFDLKKFEKQRAAKAQKISKKKGGAKK